MVIRMVGTLLEPLAHPGEFWLHGLSVNEGMSMLEGVDAAFGFGVLGLGQSAWRSTADEYALQVYFTPLVLA